MLVSRLKDLSVGADKCCPIPAIGATCGNVLVMGKPPMVVGNIWGKHPCGGKRCRHVEMCIAGIPSVLINKRPVVTTRMPLSRGDIVATGATTVHAG